MPDTLQEERFQSAGAGGRLVGPYLPVSNLPGLVITLDCMVVAIVGALAHVALLHFSPVTLEYFVFAIVFIALTNVMLLSRADMYSVNAIMRPISRSDFLIVALLTAFLLLLTIIVTLKVQDIFPKRWLAAFFVFGTASLMAERLLLSRALQWAARRGVVRRRLLVLGTGEQAQRFLSRMRIIKPYFVEIAGIFDSAQSPRRADVEGYAVEGGFEAMIAYARTHRVDDVIIALPWNEEALISETMEALRELPINVSVSTDLIGYQLAFRPVMGDAAQLPVFEVVQRPISGWSFMLKALEDYVLGALIILVLSPLLIATAIAIKLDSPGPVLFRQKRLGFNNKEFEIYKFRSMRHNVEPEQVTIQATRDDPRVTRVGRLIRATSIDELPQLFNVMEGTMSLVGPRPHALDHNEDYGRRIRGYFARHKVKPGITGWAQVNGLRGETQSIATMQARVEHDVYYAENWSLLFDIRILIGTMIIVLFQKNAY
ncbi:MAG: undecaprenyl-phosphate glucose phosphotransferase [Pseudomonadota bacterium]